MNLVLILALCLDILSIADCQMDPIEINQTPIKLGKILVDENLVTLSGFWSGGTFAQQLQIAYSSKFLGIAVFSSSYYRCGPGDGKIVSYDRVCTKLENQPETDYHDPAEVHKEIKSKYEAELIENPLQLRDKRLYVYGGMKSYMFSPKQSFGILSIYERYIKNPLNIRTRIQESNLVLPTHNSYGTKCDEFAAHTSFIGNCGFSGPYEALNFLLPSNVTKEQKAGKHIQMKILQTFDQTPFYKGIINHYMDTAGFFYVPSRCNGVFRCLLHFYFHGCLTGRQFNTTEHIVNSGFLELAELNNVVMVFPQAISSRPENEMGCWDTIGISGPDYATQKGDQIMVVKNMMDAVLGKWGRSGKSEGTKNLINKLRR